MATIAQVLDIASRVPARFRALVLLAAFTGLRYGELAALRRRDLRTHLRDSVADEPDALVFTGAKGAALRRSNFQKAAGWAASVAAAGLPGFHFHDLRHTGNTFAAGTGASTADLMTRMGHGSMIYQHATAERDRSIAQALSGGIVKERDRARSGHAEKKKR